MMKGNATPTKSSSYFIGKGYGITFLGIATLTNLILLTNRVDIQTLQKQNTPLNPTTEILQIYRLDTQGGITLTPNDTTERSKPVDRATRVRFFQDTLNIAPNNKSWAALQFVKDGFIQTYNGMVLKTIPSNTGASYIFPCMAQGNFTLSWNRVVQEGRMCNGGLTLIEDSKLASNFLPINFGQLGLKILSDSQLAQQQSTQDTVITPGADYTLLKIDTNSQMESGRRTEILVQVLTGSITVEDSRSPGGLQVNAGQEYHSSSQQRVQPMEPNCRKVSNENLVQTFIEPEYWSVDQPSKVIQDGITQHLRAQQVAVANCPVPPPPPVPPPLIRTQTVISPIETPPPLPDIDVTLEWLTDDDLDLGIINPAGQEISYKKSDHGHRDMNKGCSVVDSPTETIQWGTGTALQGQYILTVSLYSHCIERVTEPVLPVNFTVYLSIRGVKQTITGVMRRENPTFTQSFSYR